MIKSIITKFLITLVVAFAALSIFWFFKTSSLKKQVLALIASSDSKVSATSVSIGGFPFKQKLLMDDVKIQASFPKINDASLSILIPDVSYKIQIQKLDIVSSIFSKDFVINLGEVSFQNQSGEVRSIQFNQAPLSTVSLDGDKVIKFSYQDSGYKVLDSGKNVLFENGISSITFESIAEGEKYHHKIKADLKDIGALNFGNQIASAPNTNIVTPTPAPITVASDNSAKINDPALPSEAVPINPAAATPEVAGSAVTTKPENTDNGALVKKSLILDLEYALAKAPQAPSTLSAPVTTSPSDPKPNTPTVPEVTLSNETSVELVNIKNLEISSPLYKININGEIKPQKATPSSSTFSLSVRIEKLDNIFVYVKKAVTDLSNKNTNPNKVENLEILAAPAPSNDPAPNTASTADSIAVPAFSQKPEIDLAVVIKDLARKNPATNDEVAIFDFRKEQGKDLLINEIPLMEIMDKALATSSSQPLNGAVVDPAAQTSGTPANPVPAAAIPTPAPIAIPAKPANAN